MEDRRQGEFRRPAALGRRRHVPADPTMVRLITMRSNGQFNTTIYGYDDRFRGVNGTRTGLFMHRNDIARLGLREAQIGDARQRGETAFVARSTGCASRLRYSGRVLRRLLPGMQSADPALAPRRTQQGARGEIDSGADPRLAQQHSHDPK